ncbi:hypothetical protein [uncultured Methanolobus sp.]|nr:hypothetical protein [uncultured Methanolobus sp.]
MFTGDGTYELNGEESTWVTPDVDEEEETESIPKHQSLRDRTIFK